MTGIEKITPERLREIRKTAKLQRPQVIFVNRRPHFQPEPSILEEFNDYKRRFSNKDDPIKPALEGSHYEAHYRRKIGRDGKALSKLRSMVERSKRQSIYLIEEDKDRPDVDILLDIIRIRKNHGVW
jgi:hypothetical protein